MRRPRPGDRGYKPKSARKRAPRAYYFRNGMTFIDRMRYDQRPGFIRQLLTGGYGGSR